MGPQDIFSLRGIVLLLSTELSRVRVCQNLFPRVLNLEVGGDSTSLGLYPTKLPVKWGVQLGLLDVPALPLAVSGTAL